MSNKKQQILKDLKDNAKQLENKIKKNISKKYKNDPSLTASINKLDKAVLNRIQAAIKKLETQNDEAVPMNINKPSSPLSAKFTPRTKKAVQNEINNRSKISTPLKEAYKQQNMLYGKRRYMFNNQHRLESNKIVRELEEKYIASLGRGMAGVGRANAFGSTKLGSTTKNLSSFFKNFSINNVTKKNNGIK